MFSLFFIIFFTFYCSNLSSSVVYSTYVNKVLVNISGDFEINNDNIETFNSNVTLHLDFAGINQMKFGNTPAERDSASWENYVPTKSWTLPSGEGKKTVYGSLRNTSFDTINISDDIIFKTIANLPYSTGLTLWLDSKDPSSISSTSGNISAWNDKSGNEYHALQDTASEKPDLLTDGIDFNGSSEYFYLDNLNYTNANPIDGLLVCGVFKTNHISSTYNDNWAILDFDRSEWFDFYNKGGDYGFSYDSNGTVRDITTSGVGINNNEWHVACASYDNTQVNETVITVNGAIEYVGDLEPIGAQIGVSQATRFGFIGDGSEASTEDAGRNNIYYEGGIGEMVYFDTNISSAKRKDLECYLGKKWGILVTGCAEEILPITSITYSPEFGTSSNVLATIENFSENIIITNNGGSSDYIFTSNGSFNFEYTDTYGNTGSSLAIVDWIDTSFPGLVSTGSLNVAPVIESYSGANIHTITVGSGVTDIGKISALDTIYNVVGEYGTKSLSGNTWSQINTYEMCNPVVNVSHRQDVSGEIQRAPRVRSKTGTGFEVHVDNYASSIGMISTDVDYVVMNQGTHIFDGGLLINAGSQNTSAIACNASDSPTPDSITFGTNFVSPPVVTHTVSTENDSSWVVSGVNGNDGNKDSEPFVGGMGLVLQRSFNTCIHGSENIDYLAIEPGNYTLLDGTIMDATRSTDSIKSVTSSGSPILFSNAFTSTPKTVLVSQLGEDGGNGGYAQIHSIGGVSNSTVFATIDEDGPIADRLHTTEVVASLAFNKDSGYFWDKNNINYSITGGSDSADFVINNITGKLDFITGKSPKLYTDTDNNGTYEVIISACDSHCNMACGNQTILVKVQDTIPPVISGINFASGSLLPGGNHDIIFNYSDDTGGSGIDIASSNVTLERWDGTSWGEDISTSSFSSENITNSHATFSSGDLAFGKYRITLVIDDIAGNNSNILDSIFYIDIPEFNISTNEIPIGNIDHISASFSPEVTVTVKTIGSGFSVFLNKNTDLIRVGETIPSWNGINGYGFDAETYTGEINALTTNYNIVTQNGNINTNGDLNIYTYKIRMGALVKEFIGAGKYEGSIDFSIKMNY